MPPIPSNNTVLMNNISLRMSCASLLFTVPKGKSAADLGKWGEPILSQRKPTTPEEAPRVWCNSDFFQWAPAHEPVARRVRNSTDGRPFPLTPALSLGERENRIPI